MKRQAQVTFYPLALFLAIVTVAYGILGRVPVGNGEYHIEWVGLTAFILTTVMVLMIAVVLTLTSRKMDPQPEDSTRAEIADGEGEIAFFPPASIWPFWAALTAAVMFLGPVFGWWITALGGVIGIWAVCGWSYQYYKGEYAH